MHTKRKWLSAITVAALALGLGGFVATTANATQNIALPNEFCTADVAGTDAWDEKVIDHEAYDETVIVIAAQHYSLKGNSGIEKDETPLAPWGDDDYWQANTKQEPHGSDNITWLNESHTGLHYASHGSEGLRDWFYFQPEVTRTVHHDEVSHNVHHDAVPAVIGSCEVWVTWATDTYVPDADDASDVAWPQHFVGFGQIAPTECEVTYQQDLYRGTKAQIEGVIGDGTLDGYPPAEDASIVKDWRFVSTDVCPPNSFPTPTQFNAEPDPADCFAPGFFDDGALGGTLIGQDEDGRTYSFADGKVRLLVDISDAGVIHLYVFSTDDETVLTGLDATKWNINADQRSATRDITLEPQRSGEVACPTDGPSPTPTPTPTDEPSPSPEPTPPNDDDAPPATPVEHEATFTG